jgi:hypothetical protein
MTKDCQSCGRFAVTLHLDEGNWVCRECYQVPPPIETCRLFEKGHANPRDPDGTTAHVRDIQARRWHPKEKRLFYYTPPKTYFY